MDAMSDSQPADDASDFDPRRLRTITSMRRSADDRMVAGVCSGAARYLNIDPVVVRVAVACLAFVGFAGVIVYVAAWLLVPEEGDDESLVDEHLPDSVDREQVRRIGLFVAGAIALASVLGSGFTVPGASIPIALAALALFYIFVVVPYNKRRSAATASDASAPSASALPAGPDAPTQTLGEPPSTGTGLPTDGKRPRNPRRDSGRLFGITTAVAVIVVAGMAVYSQTTESIDWPYYPLAALFVVGAGMVVGTYLGNGRPLALLGIPLALIMLLTTVLPTYTIGDERHEPAFAADIHGSYEQGVGNFVLDLTNVSDVGSLDGRTVDIDQGVGSLEVIVPDDLNVDVEAQTEAGSLRLLERSTDGAPVSSHYVDPADSDPVLHLDINQTAGEIRVTRS